ncbi:uncharacterized protein LOC105834486 isoform X1 [Monomorium pharaonis]|uniref:uncharacterized protein LOC105834486 isoform X1 n=2 Tax=Monomorium pharaonis TaxID=307658 RepID=UPI00063FC55F|nr:uncharacterized protein LOC105834486 isoform X1 [Monomorium pharaonis]XP_012532465.1 uncharacterized protein LOC105834486 isoform X1 [Monomorium pharaonis]XP_036147673.1 uncharacterized protein LOC105834486 isoform X1 [Monomorium pharaonis]
MNEVTDNFAWTHQLECPPTVYNDSVKKILCKGVLELLWEDISNSVFPTAEVCKIRKNILLHKLKHGLNDSAISSIRNFNQLKVKSNTVKQQISTLEKEYEEQDYNVRQKMQQLKDIKSECLMTSTRKDFLKLKHSETSKQLQDCSDMRRVCQHLMPNTSRDINQQRLRENLDIVANLRRSAADKKQVWTKVSNFLGGIDVHTLWTHLYQALSQDLDALMKFETKNIDTSSSVGENIDIGIARACGQYICMISKRILSNAKANIYQQRLVEFIALIEQSSTCEDVSTWLAIKLEVKKLEAEQAYLQNKVQKLKNIIQENSLLNLDIAQLTTDIETVDAQMDKYIKDIQQSIAVLNSTSTLIFKEKEKLHYELQKIMALQANNYDAKCMNNALDIELDMFYNTLDLDALRKVMLKGDVGLYRHAICGLDKVSITTVNPQYSRIKPYFPIIQMPIYSLIECYKNAIANIIYTKLHRSMEDMNETKCIDKSVPPREKCNYNSLELLNLASIVCDQAREEIKRFNAVLNTWTNQDVQEAMALNETTVDGVFFKDWLQRYNLLLYMIQNSK